MIAKVKASWESCKEAYVDAWTARKQIDRAIEAYRVACEAREQADIEFASIVSTSFLKKTQGIEGLADTILFADLTPEMLEALINLLITKIDRSMQNAEYSN